MAQSVDAVRKTAEVAIMYVRNVPETLVRVVRSQAALRGEAMQEWVLEAVRQRLEREGVDVPEDDER